MDSKGPSAEEILTRIIYASDQCRGHRGCGHSMQPWADARALLFGETPDAPPPPDPAAEVEAGVAPAWTIECHEMQQADASHINPLAGNPARWPVCQGHAFEAAAEATRVGKECAAALKGVVRVADRSTDEFDAARAALAEARKMGWIE